jgi:hypothetical protein
MRELTAHRINPANDKLTITVTDKPGAGGANHRYEISGYDAGTNGGYSSDLEENRTVILFQNGPIAENGVNGLTQEALLVIVADRLNSFQNGPFACLANEIALEKIQEAIEVLHARTKERMNRGVEGKNVA